jgi:HK97 gp10 family phage protein
MGFKLNLKTDKFMRDVEKKVEAGMEDAAELVTNKAKQLVPVDTGALKNSIDYEVNRIGRRYNVRVSATEPYAIFVEMGTHKMDAQPYLRPALFNNRTDILRKVAGK